MVMAATTTFLVAAPSPFISHETSASSIYRGLIDSTNLGRTYGRLYVLDSPRGDS